MLSVAEEVPPGARTLAPHKSPIGAIYRWAGRAGLATGPAEADVDDRHVADTGLGEAGPKSPVRERCVANVIHFRPPAT